MNQYCQTRNCLHCANYAIWDNDYCCVYNLNIISYGDSNTGEAITPDVVLLDFNCKDFKHNTVKKNDYNKEIWNCLNPNNKVK